MSSKLYDLDFYEWAKEQADILRGARLAELDTEHIIEELESMAGRDVRELRSRLRRLLEHKLKLHLIKGRVLEDNCQGWRISARNQRAEIEQLLDESPSLRRKVSGLLAKAYELAAADVRDAYLVEPPAECPWTEEEILG
jgi:hypothetical protein